MIPHFSEIKVKITKFNKCISLFEPSFQPLWNPPQVAQTGDALVDIEVSGSGGEGASASVASGEVEVQETEAINVGSSEDNSDSGKRSAKVLATPAVRWVLTKLGQTIQFQKNI